MIFVEYSHFSLVDGGGSDECRQCRCFVWAEAVGNLTSSISGPRLTQGSQAPYLSQDIERVGATMRKLTDKAR